MLDLKANPNKNAIGTVIESELDKGRGYISTILVEAGTLHIGDVILAGSYFGHAKAMYNERGKRIEEAGPATPVQILGLNGAPQAGDKFHVMLAVASNAIIVGFQVRPSMNARKLAEKEEIDIRLYSVIYDAINEVRDAMEGMLSPEIKEEIVGTAEVRDTFKIKKVGTVAGCIVKEGKLTRNTKVRVIRDGIVIYTGDLGSLKRFKDDVKEVVSGYECGLNIENFNDIKVGDVIEGFQEVEVKKTL